MKYDFIIVGGGIAGLTTAIALQKDGYHVKVLERSTELKVVGAGLGLGANAWKGLKCLGITKDLEMKCHLIKSTKFFDQKGDLISEMDFERLNHKYGLPILLCIVRICKKYSYNVFCPIQLNLEKEWSTLTKMKRELQCIWKMGIPWKVMHS